MADRGYRDPLVRIDGSELTVRGYYPWGAKRLPLAELRGVERVPVALLAGRWRIWGTTTLHHWANRDFRRPFKHVGFVLETGHPVRPFVTPDDPDAFETALRAAGTDVRPGGRRVI